MVETILKSSNILATLISDVVDLSRLEDGILELDIGIFNLHTLFWEVHNLIKPIVSVKKLLVTLSLSSELPEFAIGDEKRITQVLLNVVGNAVKFTKEGSISISAFVAKPESLGDTQDSDFLLVPTENHFYLCVQVKDTGSGINPQDIPKLFSKVAHSQPLATKNSGSGLGLAICKRFVNLMEGHFWIESEGIGKGSTAIFVVKLGIPGHSNEPKLPFVPALSFNGDSNFQELKVWVVDDNRNHGQMDERKLFEDRNGWSHTETCFNP